MSEAQISMRKEYCSRGWGATGTCLAGSDMVRFEFQKDHSGSAVVEEEVEGVQDQWEGATGNSLRRWEVKEAVGLDRRG